MMCSILLNPQLIIYSTALGTTALTVRIVSCFICGIVAGLLVHFLCKGKPFFHFGGFEEPHNHDTDPNLFLRLVTIAAEKLYSLFGIGMVLICGGGTVNWTFLQQGVVDELSLLLAPAADGMPSTPSVFEKCELLQSSVSVEFALKNVERLGKNGVRLVYMVQSGTKKD